MIVRLKHVQRVVVKGRVYHYHRPTRTRIKAAPGTAAFVEEVTRLNAARDRVEVRGGTLGALIAAYRASIEFKGKAPRTQRDYLKVLDWLQPMDGAPLTAIEPPDVMAIRDKAFGQHKRRFSTMVLQVLSILFNWGIPRGLCASNPADGLPRIPRPKGAPKPNRRWSEEEISVALERMPLPLRRAVAISSATGLREGDVIRLTWANLVSGALEADQGKTGDRVWVPLPDDVLSVLGPPGAPDEPVVSKGRGSGAYTENGFRSSFFAEIRRLEAAGLVRPGLTFHGLRRTVASSLAEKGATTREIMSVTGHRTEAIVSTYVRDAEKRELAKRATRRLKGEL